MSATVYLLGAGPGDGGLLTRKAEQLLTKAEVVVYDRLVGDDILALIPPQAERINVGKHAGNHPVPQERINEILLEKALEGKRVVRLKGGDGFLFGRGGEELELLREHGISFEVVPGVPSPIAAAAYAGIPVTHRDFCASVHFITGHRKADGALNLDYEALVRLNGTLVFLMSVATCGEIASGLMSHGMSSEMDCAVIENGTRPEQRKFIATVGTIAGVIQEQRITSPALIVVGRVCSLSDRFDWFSELPLHGVSVLVTAPATGSGRLEHQLRELGAGVTVLPAIATVPLDVTLPELSGVRAVIFTSATGVRAVFSALLERGRDARMFGGVIIAAVGRETSEALRQYGILPDLVPPIFSGEALGRELLERELLKPGETALLLRAKKAAPGLPAVLKQAGVRVEELAVYETVALPLEEINPVRYDWVTFTSAGCVESFRASCEGSGFFDFGSVNALCIGPQTAKSAQALGMKVSVSKKATLASMAEFLKEAAV
ncbi:MAG: uroporphyrin-III C-methyltransferase [Oscillospiraceae bacterium]|nr:uroporphyrin-III C-methyltransferase [Oscillospiraceae bacterium]